MSDSPDLRVSKGLRIDEHVNGFALSVHGRKIIEHSIKSPFVEIGSSEPKVESLSGFFKIREGILQRKSLKTHKLLSGSKNQYIL